MRMLTVGVAAMLLLVLAGCGGSDDEQAKQAIAASIMNGSDSTFSVSRSEADCIAAGFVDDIGVEKLKEYGVLTEGKPNTSSLQDITMSPTDADAAATAFVDCVDLQQLMTDALPLQSLDPVTVDCVKKALSEDVIHDILAASFRGDDPATAAPDLTQTLTACVSS